MASLEKTNSLVRRVCTKIIWKEYILKYVLASCIGNLILANKLLSINLKCVEQQNNLYVFIEWHLGFQLLVILDT